ncbi:MAG: hypothetical protein AB7F86_15510 [Bdellovibrionales bacterium]
MIKNLAFLIMATSMSPSAWAYHFCLVKIVKSAPLNDFYLVKACDGQMLFNDKVDGVSVPFTGAVGDLIGTGMKVQSCGYGVGTSADPNEQPYCFLVAP